MKRALVSLAVMGLAGVALGVCDPTDYDRPYGHYRDFSQPLGYGQPPPPPPPDYPPPPGYGPPPPHAAPLTPGQVAHMNDPAWCKAHPQRCAHLHSLAEGQQPPQGYGPPPQGYGPPPQNGYGPPPPQYGGAPQGYNLPPPNNGEANGPPQQMQQPQ